VTDIELRNRFAHLDVGQLVKHYLGLANTFTSGRVVLLYLFWEPVNAGDFEVFGEHRRELHEFARVVAGDRIEFAYQSYPELWCQWEALEVHVTQRQYFERLRARYLVRV
jgi:hypothetical protein